MLVCEEVKLLVPKDLASAACRGRRHTGRVLARWCLLYGGRWRSLEQSLTFINNCVLIIINFVLYLYS